MSTLRLNLDEMKMIRNCLYSTVGRLRDQLKEQKNLTDKVRETVCDALEEHEKLICYLSDKIVRGELV